MLDKTDQQIAAILEKLSKLADVHGDEAVRLAVEVSQRDAAQIIFIGCGLLVISVLSLFVALRFWRAGKAIEKERGEAWHDNEEVKFQVGSMALGIIGGIATIPTGILLLNYWAWVGLTNPKLYLAHKIMDKLL